VITTETVNGSRGKKKKEGFAYAQGHGCWSEAKDFSDQDLSKPERRKRDKPTAGGGEMKNGDHFNFWRAPSRDRGLLRREGFQEGEGPRVTLMETLRGGRAGGTHERSWRGQELRAMNAPKKGRPSAYKISSRAGNAKKSV